MGDKYLYLKVVESITEPGQVSIRPCDAEGNILGSASVLRRMLKERGFQAGDMLKAERRS